MCILRHVDYLNSVIIEIVPTCVIFAGLFVTDNRTEMGKYKLVYFDGRGRGEVSRLLFAQAGVAYEDKRLTREEWAEHKKSTLFGQLPYMEVDGETICQSKAIERLLAKRFGLAGKTDIEQAKVDMIMDCMDDMNKPMPAIFREQDEKKKAELKKKFEEEELPDGLQKIEKLLKMNKGGDGYFVGDEVTLADICVAQLLTFPGMMGINIKYENYPKLKALKDRVEALPKIAQWIANRPETPF